MKCPACESTDIKLFSRDRILGGAATGAAVGSVFPVIGTVLGGLMGGALGALSNDPATFGGEKRFVCQACQNKFSR